MKKNYSFIWYPLTSYYEISDENVTFKIAEKISPYLELNDVSINKLKNKEEIEINPYYRFSKEVHDILTPDNYQSDKNLIDKFVNINFHILGEVDLYVGQNKKDIYVKEILKGIKNGELGDDLKENILLFKGYEQHMIADLLYEMYNNLNMIDSFKKIIKLIFPDSIIYDNISSQKKLILYLNYSRSENRKKIKIIKRIFFPIGLEIDIFWETHFGVIGYPITMKIGEISIY
ncbi:hypothetical protein H3N56_11540 [Cetobacterium sp. 2A]|uniref:hypothetical protein n=1 Tax=Cetobacterium sp. 2A TaxID=2754723 RepID=UPI00163C1BD3|nr:hypothetical protein [Cetobacterium sp. 2A]MBC2857065.1 hypothetical protein [Cetobacterium sp. 2A]